MSDILNILKGKKPKTSDEFVLELLAYKEDELDKASKHIATLEQDLKDFNATLVEIKSHFKIEKTISDDEYKIVATAEGHYGKSENTIYFSGSLKPEKFKPEFITFMKMLGLELPVEPLDEEHVIPAEEER